MSKWGGDSERFDASRLVESALLVVERLDIVSLFGGGFVSASCFSLVEQLIALAGPLYSCEAEFSQMHAGDQKPL
jgi:hypothetical protein